MAFNPEMSIDEIVSEMKRILALSWHDISIEEAKEIFGFLPDDKITKENLVQAHKDFLQKYIYKKEVIDALRNEGLDFASIEKILDIRVKLLPLAMNINLESMISLSMHRASQVDAEKAKKILGFDPHDSIDEYTINHAFDQLMDCVRSFNLTCQQLINIVQVAKAARNQLSSFIARDEESSAPESKSERSRVIISPAAKEEFLEIKDAGQQSNEKIHAYVQKSNRPGSKAQDAPGILAIVFPDHQMRNEFAKVIQYVPGDHAIDRIKLSKKDVLSEDLKRNAERSFTPLLIQRDGEYSIYGCKNGAWIETPLTSLRPLEIEKLEEIFNIQWRIEAGDAVFNNAIFIDILKSAHSTSGKAIDASGENFEDETNRGLFFKHTHVDGKDVITFETDEQAEKVHNLLFGGNPQHKREGNKIAFDQLRLYNPFMCIAIGVDAYQQNLPKQPDTLFLSDCKDIKPREAAEAEAEAEVDPHQTKSDIFYTKIDAIGYEAKHHFLQLVLQLENESKLANKFDDLAKTDFTNLRVKILTQGGANCQSLIDKLPQLNTPNTQAILEQMQVYRHIIEKMPTVADRKIRNKKAKYVAPEDCFNDIKTIIIESERKMLMHDPVSWRHFKQIHQMITKENNSLELEQKNILQELKLLQSQFDFLADKPKRYFGSTFTKAESKQLKDLKNEFLKILDVLVKIEPDLQKKIEIYKKHQNSTIVKTYRGWGLFAFLRKTDTRKNIDSIQEKLESDLKNSQQQDQQSSSWFRMIKHRL